MRRTHSTAVREVAIVGRMSRALAAAVFAVALGACSKDEAPAPAEMGASPDVSGDVSASRGVGADAGAGTSVAEAACGDKLVLCPLKAWMRAHTAVAVNAHDFQGLAGALEKVAGFAPPGYPHWTSIARDGADAARAQDIEAVRGACRGCHSQYRDNYKRDLRARPLGI